MNHKPIIIETRHFYRRGRPVRVTAPAGRGILRLPETCLWPGLAGAGRRDLRFFFRFDINLSFPEDRFPTNAVFHRLSEHTVRKLCWNDAPR